MDTPSLIPRDPLADLLAYSGHELRTPLTSLTLAVEMCADGSLGPLTPVLAETLGGALADCARLRRLIDALTDPVLAGDHARVARMEFDLRTALASAITATRDLATERGVGVVCPTPVSPATWQGDPERVARLLAHGLGHALTCAQRGSELGLTTATAHGQARIAITWRPAGDAPGRTMELWLSQRLAAALGGSVASSSGRLDVRIG